MKDTRQWIIAATLIFYTCPVHAAPVEPNLAVPSVSVSVAEGMLILFKDGHTAPGGMSFRLHTGLGWKLPDGFGVFTLIGFITPHTTFQPFPRVVAGVSYGLTDKLGVSMSALYQFNYGYNGAKHSHLFGFGPGVSYKVGSGFSLTFATGPAMVFGGGWSFLFQPGVSYVF